VLAGQALAHVESLHHAHSASPGRKMATSNDKTISVNRP